MYTQSLDLTVNQSLGDALKVTRGAAGISELNPGPIQRDLAVALFLALTRGVTPNMLILAKTETTEIRLQSVSSTAALELQSRLRTRWPAILAHSQELRKEIPDPVGSIAELFKNLPSDNETWQEIVEEPYG